MNKAEKARLEKIVKAGYMARDQLSAYEAKQKDKANQELIGKCYRYKNSYGGKDFWWLYAKVIGVEDGWLRLFKFEKTGNGTIEIDPDRATRSLGGYKPISKAEFDYAYHQIMLELGDYE